MTLNDKVELYFFDHTKSEDEYINFYSSLCFNKGIEDLTRKIVRFSPLYQLLKDIRICLGQDENLPRGYPYPYKAGILLMNILVNTLARDIKNIGNWNKGKKTIFFVELLSPYLEKKEDSKVLRFLRNSLDHNKYSLNWREKGGWEYIFNYGIGKTNKMLSVSEDASRKIKFCTFYPCNLYLNLITEIKKIQEKLSSCNDKKMKKHFENNFKPDYWVGRNIATSSTINVQFIRN